MRRVIGADEIFQIFFLFKLSTCSSCSRVDASFVTCMKVTSRDFNLSSNAQMTALLLPHANFLHPTLSILATVSLLLPHFLRTQSAASCRTPHTPQHHSISNGKIRVYKHATLQSPIHAVAVPLIAALQRPYAKTATMPARHPTENV